MNVRSLASLLVGLTLVMITTVAVTVLCVTRAGSAPAEEKGPIYAQLSSAMTQTPKDAPLIVQMESNDALAGLVHSDKEKTGELTVKVPGVYFVVAAIQVGKESGDSDEYVDVWLKQNGKDVDNSGCRQAIKDPKFTTVLVSQGIAECKAGDVFQVAISASSPGKGLGIIASKPKGEPAIPSIIFSMYKIN
jgi:hypothetical protein